MKRLVLKSLLRVLGSLAVVALVAYSIPKVMLFMQIRAARSEHIPLDPSDLADSLRVNPTDNAAPLYAKANTLLMEAMRKQGSFEAGKISFFDVSPSVELKYADDVLTGYSATLQAAAVAASKHSIDFDRDWSKGFKLSTPEYDQMRSLVILECGKGEVLTATGKDKEALDCFQQAESISYQSGKDPTLDSNMAFMRSQTAICRSLTDIVQNVDRRPAFLEGVEKMLTSLPTPKSLGFYLGGQFVLDRETIERLPNLTQDDYDQLLAGVLDEQKQRLERLLKIGALNSLYEENFIAYYRNLLNTLPKDETNWRELKAVSVRTDKLAMNSGIAGTATAFFAKPLIVYCDADVKVIARKRFLLTLVRLAEIENKTGTAPANLPVNGSDTVDPFNGQKFDYKTHDGTFTLSADMQDKAQMVVPKLAVRIGKPQAI